MTTRESTYCVDGALIPDIILLKKAAYYDMDFNIDYWTKNVSEAAQILRDHGHSVVKTRSVS